MKKSSSQSGQVTIEAILLLVLFVGMGYGVSGVFKNQRVLQKMIQGPWQYIAGMAESGVWMKQAPARAYHPGHVDRHFTAVDR